MKGFIAALIFVPAIAIADTFEYGWLPVVGAYKSSLDIDTEVKTAANALSGLIIINSGRSSRIWVQGQYHSLDFSGSQTLIGQSVSGIEVSSIYQSQYRLSRHFKPWLGIGIGISALDYSERFRTDSDGFLLEKYPDTSEILLTLEINATADLDWFEDYDTGVAIRTSIPGGDGLAKVEAGFYIIF